MAITSVNNNDSFAIPNDTNIERKEVKDNRVEERRQEREEAADYYEKAVVLQDKDGVVTRTGAKESTRAEDILQKTGNFNTHDELEESRNEETRRNEIRQDIFNKDDIELKGKTQRELKELYESGQISESDYELELQKRGVSEDKNLVERQEEREENKTNEKSESTASKAVEENRQKQLDEMRKLGESMMTKESFSQTMDRAKDLLKQSERFEKVDF